jgi:hypothetical protein
MLLTLCETIHLRIGLTYSLAAQRLQDMEAVYGICDALLSFQHVNASQLLVTSFLSFRSCISIITLWLRPKNRYTITGDCVRRSCGESLSQESYVASVQRRYITYWYSNDNICAHSSWKRYANAHPHERFRSVSKIAAQAWP